MANRPAVTSPNLWIAGIVLVAIVVAILAVTGVDRLGQKGSGLSDAFDYSIEAYRHVDPALIRYKQVQEIPTGMQEARAVAIGPEDQIYVAGDQAIYVFAPDAGRIGNPSGPAVERIDNPSGPAPRRKIELEAAPRCLAVAGAGNAHPGRIYVGMDNHVQVLDEHGQPTATWEDLGERALITSIAVAEQDVFVADAGNLLVMHYNLAGQLVGRIGARDGRGGSMGFVVPSPYFDVAVGPSDVGGIGNPSHNVLYVANPGAQRIESYSFDGDLEAFWGKAASSIEGFFGCCNPAHFAVLPDGRFVTAEKGLLRVKTYTSDGEFDSVVAGPEQLDTAPRAADGSLWDQEYRAVDVAADSRGRVLVLDLAGGSVRVYEPKQVDESK